MVQSGFADNVRMTSVTFSFLLSGVLEQPILGAPQHIASQALRRTTGTKDVLLHPRWSCRKHTAGQ